MITFTQFRDAIQHGVYFIIDPGVRLMVRLGVTPNMMTTVGLFGNIAAAALFVYSALTRPADDFSLILLSGVLTILFSIFDMVDGYMARTANMCSTFGAFYDSVLDRYCELFTLAGMTFYFSHHGYTFAAIITMLSLIGSIMVSYVRARAEGLDLECKVGLMQRPERVVLTALGAILCGALAPCVSSSFDPMWILIVPQIIIAILANYTAMIRINHVRKLLKGK